MAPLIKKVALAGATGNIGSKTMRALADAGKFEITVLHRRPIELPQYAGVTVRIVNFESVDSLSAALQGHQAVIDCTSDLVGETSIRLIDAAVAAHVYRFIPSEYSHPANNAKVRQMPIFAMKDQTHHYLRQLASEGKISYSSVSSGAFLDWNLATGFMNIDLDKKNVQLLNEGDVVFSWTLLSTIGKAVVQVLLHLKQTKNRVIHIHSVWKSQRQMVDLAMAALGGDGWSITTVDADAAAKKAQVEFQAQNINPQVLGDLIRYAVSRPEFIDRPKQDDNALLGLSGMADEEVKDLIREIAAPKK
ncbi:hypothetical protein BDV26DRAFT_281743 [Aspergillus bertholletiae]|uniref:NmrA-like domain-containing protein n=1 Tax=Aspergillus bertholletiae TaxID=1226010 RepID=A0A5N7B697_9EURO|nr:hypothetical protein BDV26DRAFT_281743 [Aspergillus bertholletiae]